MIYLRNTTESQQVYIPRQVIQTATTREVNYITSGDVINMIDSKLEDYWNSGETEVAIDDAISAESARCEETYAKPSDIPDVSDFVTSAEVETQITDKNYVNSADVKTQIEAYNYTTSAETETQINEAIAIESARCEETYAKPSDIPDVSDFVTSAEVKTQIDNTISAYTKTSDFATINGSAITEGGNIIIEGGGVYSAGTNIDITDNVISVTGIDISNFVTSAEVETQINEAIAIESARCESTYLKEHQSLAGLFASADYISTAKTIYFYDKSGNTIDSIDATDFIKDGMVDNVYISGNTLYIVFNTDAGKETIEIDLTDIFDANNYYTKQDIDNKHFVDSGQTQSQIEAYSENFVTSAEVETQITDKNYVNSGDVKTQIEAYNYTTSAETETQINGAIATESARTEETYAKQSDIPDVSNFVDSADVKTQIEAYNYINSGQAQTQIENNISAYTKTSDFATINGSGITNGGNLVIEGGGATYTAGDGIDITNDVISVTGKQETLVSGTNIKTINNESILGQGNIEIQGGGNNYIELTQAEYNALSAYQEDALYVISDAEEVDLNNYVTSGDLQTFSAATVSALNNKATKANVTANTNMQFPKWNSEGVVTGTTGNTVYAQNLSINGTQKTMLQTTNSSFGNIYAPTTAGSQGQPLISNGSGAPVWASFKFWYGTETEYDAITTKDSNTIYFVKPD